ncbi:MAG: radical SAM protein [Bacteroidota bacterium]|jgi:MoaA/NifB/PqqE/SkfB family radical SAM enzyme|nr:radical SAM protein [Bacteroidota bacterium]
MPLLCNYYLTYRCNAFCAFCHFGDHAAFRDTRHARTEDVMRNLAAMRRLGVRFVDLTGGEPLLHPDIGRIAAETRRLGMRSSVTTNGLLYPKRAAELAGNVDLLHFSLDSADPAQHDAMRGIACFDAIMESIVVARRLGERPDLLFTVTDDNYAQVEGVYAIAREHGLMLLLNPVFQYFQEEGLGEAAMTFIETFARRPMVYLNPSFLTLRRRGGNDITAPLCRAVSRVLVISPENEILLPCYHLHFERLPIGDDLDAAWNSERVRWHREREGRHDFCQGCAINCYFEPSFAFPTNRLSLAAVPSKLKYGYTKYIVQPFLPAGAPSPGK